MKQYEIWWADLPLPIGRRPVLLLSRPAAYQYLAKILIAEVSSTIRSIPQEVGLGRREGLARSSVANFDNLHVIPRVTLRRRIGALAANREKEVKRAMGYALGWPELKIL